MSSLANRLLQVGLLSSIASRPLSSANSFLAVSIKSCVFIQSFQLATGIMGCGWPRNGQRKSPVIKYTAMAANIKMTQNQMRQSRWARFQ
jgi:hypothetical protein